MKSGTMNSGNRDTSMTGVQRAEHAAKIEDRPMMKCGCVAQSVCRSMGGKTFDPPIPSCVIHDCIEVAETQPDLTGRTARCAYGSHADQPSSRALPFFEYRGPGSPEAADHCICGYFKSAHENAARPLKCKSFTAHGPYEFDRYYCGCRGWD